MQDMSHPMASLAQRLVEQLVDDLDGSYCAQVATVDGFELAQAQRREISASRLAAMSSALAALGGELAREAGLGRNKRLIVDADEGYAVAQLVTATHGELVVTVLADRGATLAMVILQTAACGKQLEHS